MRFETIFEPICQAIEHQQLYGAIEHKFAPVVNSMFNVEYTLSQAGYCIDCDKTLKYKYELHTCRAHANKNFAPAPRVSQRHRVPVTRTPVRSYPQRVFYEDGSLVVLGY